jgi:aquaporin Z|mmetsp:Transcript_105226/g.166125  ORF Transcript_105226/g.166125 Transcript_105226/m.166125 type:complete len:252 (-) Transcript_105226:45-800(-)
MAVAALAGSRIEAYVSEFVGTYFLVLTVGINVLQNTALAPIAIGAILMAMVFATGKVSGGHFNPAVTFGVYLRGSPDMDPRSFLNYVLAQLAGGFAAGCTYVALLRSSFTLGPGAGYGFGAVLIVELLFTAALVFVVLNVATVTTRDGNNWYFGLAIGFTVMAAAFAIGPISGCALNPAVVVGVMMSNFIHTGSVRISVMLLYTFAALLGAALAFLLFRVVRHAEFERPQTKEPQSPTSSRKFSMLGSGEM